MKKEDLIRLVVLIALVGVVLFGEETPMLTLGHQQTTNLIVSDDKMREILAEYMESNPNIQNTLQDAKSAKLHTFISLIAKLETGSLVNKNVRTKVRGSGSSAWGEWQITRGLLLLVVKNKVIDFTDKELDAIYTLTERQRVALQVGGKDRKDYALGGYLREAGEAYAKLFSYEDVDKFLDDFDYGGSLGLGADKEFIKLYTSIAHKLLAYTLEQAEGNLVVASGVWHGGLGNKGPHVDKYKKKFKELLDEVSDVDTN